MLMLVFGAVITLYLNGSNRKNFVHGKVFVISFFIAFQKTK